MYIKKDICKVLSKEEIELMKNDMAHVLVMTFYKEVVFDIIFAFLVKIRVNMCHIKT